MLTTFFFSRKSCRLLNNIVEQDWSHMALAYCMLYVYKHTFRICNTYYFSIATMFARKCFNFDDLDIKELC